MITAFLLVVSLLLGRNLSHTKFQPNRIHDSVNVHVFISQRSNLSKQTSEFNNRPMQSAVDQCSWNVSQTDQVDCNNISFALNQTCTDPQGYDIVMLDIEHNEHIEIEKNQTILIRGLKINKSIWRVNDSYNNIITLNQGDLALEYLNFQFSISNSSQSNIIPHKALISVGNNDWNPSLTVTFCTFQSISGYNIGSLYHIYAFKISKINLYNSTFSGIGINEQSNISMINVRGCKEVILKFCIFKDISIYQANEAIHIQQFENIMNLDIHDCQFANIISNPENSAALFVAGDNNLSARITWNNFINCSGSGSNAGALYILIHSSTISNSNEIKVINNIFSYNAGQYSGAIYIEQINSNTLYNINNNKFTSNNNNQTDQTGQDACITFQDPPDEWTQDTTMKMIKDWFKGCLTNLRKKSVYFEGDRNLETYMSGSIKLKQFQLLSLWEIIWIVVGSAVIAFVVLILIIIISIVLFKKRQSKIQSTIEERQSLILRNSFRSV